jgi:hypothetical protein
MATLLPDGQHPLMTFRIGHPTTAPCAAPADPQRKSSSHDPQPAADLAHRAGRGHRRALRLGGSVPPGPRPTPGSDRSAADRRRPRRRTEITAHRRRPPAPGRAPLSPSPPGGTSQSRYSSSCACSWAGPSSAAPALPIRTRGDPGQAQPAQQAARPGTARPAGDGPRQDERPCR